MPRLNRPPVFFYAISLLTLAVGVLGLRQSYTTAATLRGDTASAIEVPPTASDAPITPPVELTPDESASRPPSDAASSDEQDAPSEQEIAVSLPAPAYTVRLIPSEDTLAPATLAIFDAWGATVEQRVLVLPCLRPDDRTALTKGIEAEDLGAARELLADFCE